MANLQTWSCCSSTFPKRFASSCEPWPWPHSISPRDDQIRIDTLVPTLSSPFSTRDNMIRNLYHSRRVVMTGGMVIDWLSWWRNVDWIKFHCDIYAWKRWTAIKYRNAGYIKPPVWCCPIHAPAAFPLSEREWPGVTTSLTENCPHPTPTTTFRLLTITFIIPSLRPLQAVTVHT